MTDAQPDVETPASTNTRGPLPKWALPAATGLAGFLLGIIATVAVGTIASTVGAAVAEDSRSTFLSDILDDCGITDDVNAEIGDEGRTLTVNHRGEDDFDGLAYSDVECILDGLDTPAAVDSHIGQTTSMDGRQTESWGDITMSWSYHPDRGIDFVVTVD